MEKLKIVLKYVEQNGFGSNQQECINILEELINNSVENINKQVQDVRCDWCIEHDEEECGCETI